MKLPGFIERYIVKLAITKYGPLLTKGATAVIAAVVAFIAQKAPGLEAYLNEYILTGILWLVIDYVYGLIPESIQVKYGKELQQVLNNNGAGLKIDGYVGPKTVEGAAKAIAVDK
jgi:hypothetical protein